MVFTQLGSYFNEEEFLRWLVTFQEHVAFSEDNQAMVCGIRFDFKSGEYTGMVFVKFRTVGIRTLVETWFDEAVSPFPPRRRIRVRQPARPMEFEVRNWWGKGGARFESDVYRAY